MYRRDFIEKLTQLSLLIGATTSVTSSLDNNSNEAYWLEIQSHFTIAGQKAKYLNLNSGSAGVMPTPVLSAVQDLQSFMNSVPPYQAQLLWKEQMEEVNERLAAMIGASSDEICIVRNATEALNILIQGYSYKKTDHVLASNMDYPYMLYALKKKQIEIGFDLEIINLELPSEDPEKITDQYLSKIKPNTRLLLLTHMTHSTGQILPVKLIKSKLPKDIDIILDSAHTVGQLDFSVKNLDIDFMGTSLHKWLMAPIGTGLVYVQKDRISDIIPFFNTPEKLNPNSMVKFNYIGTRPFYNEVGIRFALDYHDNITTTKKRDRLCYLQNYLLEKLKELPKIESFTPQNQNLKGAILAINIDRQTNFKIVSKLKNDHNIITKTTSWVGNNGPLIRISPNIFTLPSDIDFFIEKLKITLNSLK